MRIHAYILPASFRSILHLRLSADTLHVIAQVLPAARGVEQNVPIPVVQINILRDHIGIRILVYFFRLQPIGLSLHTALHTRKRICPHVVIQVSDSGSYGIAISQLVGILEPRPVKVHKGFRLFGRRAIFAQSRHKFSSAGVRIGHYLPHTAIHGFRPIGRLRLCRTFEHSAYHIVKEPACGFCQQVTQWVDPTPIVPEVVYHLISSPEHALKRVENRGVRIRSIRAHAGGAQHGGIIRGNARRVIPVQLRQPP